MKNVIWMKIARTISLSLFASFEYQSSVFQISIFYSNELSIIIFHLVTNTPTTSELNDFIHPSYNCDDILSIVRI